MKKTKVLVAILILLCSITLLSACNSNSASTETDTDKTELSTEIKDYFETTLEDIRNEAARLGVEAEDAGLGAAADILKGNADFLTKEVSHLNDLMDTLSKNGVIQSSDKEVVDSSIQNTTEILNSLSDSLSKNIQESKDQ